MQGIMIAGSHNYLGQHLLKETRFRELPFRVMGQNIDQLLQMGISPSQIIPAAAGQALGLADGLKDVQCLISSYGSSRLYPRASESKANYHLLQEAKLSGLKKLIFVLPLFPKAKLYKKALQEQAAFCQAVKDSGLDYLIFKVNYLFPDFRALLQEAERGKIKLFGWGQYRLNPLHGEDLAQIILDRQSESRKVFEIGGPEVFTLMEIANLALKAQGKYPQIKHRPHWLKPVLKLIKSLFQSPESYRAWRLSPLLLRQNLLGERHGIHRLQAYFRCEAQSLKPQS